MGSSWKRSHVLLEDRLLPANRGSQKQEEEKEGGGMELCVHLCQEPQEVIHEDKAPVEPRECEVQKPQQEGGHPAPV